MTVLPVPKYTTFTSYLNFYLTRDLEKGLSLKEVISILAMITNQINNCYIIRDVHVDLNNLLKHF